MKAALITHPGFEKAAAKEVVARINCKTQTRTGVVLFSAPEKEILKFSYSNQSGIHLMALISNLKISNIDKILEKEDISKWLHKNEKFAVHSTHFNNDMTTKDLNRIIGDKIIQNIKNNKGYKQKVDLENPDVGFLFCVFGKEGYFGVDLVGFDLSKREYKIFSHPASLRGSFAFCMLMHSGFEKDMVIVDPFCGSGVIPIEATLYAVQRSPQYYKKDKFLFQNMTLFRKHNAESVFKSCDSQIVTGKTNIKSFDYLLHHVKSTKKNAKIAGISKQFSCTRVEVEWLDTKFGKDSVDRIVTHPPFISKRTNKKEIEKTYEQLFYASKFVLKSDGNITILLNNLEYIMPYADKYGFNLKSKLDVFQGDEKLEIGVFSKNP